MPLSSTVQWGRRLRVTLTMGGEDEDLVVCDYDDSRAEAGGAASSGLDASFAVTRHTLIEPQPLKVQVWGLSRERRERLTRQANEALERAYRTRSVRRIGRVAVEAGRPGGSFGLLLSAEAMEVRHHREGADWRTEITAQDGRLAWKSGFVSESATGNTDLLTIEEILRAAIPVLEGEEPADAFRAAAPELLQRKGYDGPSEGFVAFGPWAASNEDILQVLGLRSFWNSGRLITVGANELALTEAIELVYGSTLLRADTVARGYVEADALLDHRLEPGRQVILRREDGTQYGLSATYRIDQVEHRGSSWSQEWMSAMVLRPTGLAQPV